MTTAGYSQSQNKVAVSSKIGNSDPNNCAEDFVAKKLGYPKDIEFVDAKRPRTREVKPKCERCTTRYGEDN